MKEHFDFPPCHHYLNSEAIEIKPGYAKMRYTPSEQMENPFGVIQGGILAGMVDHVLGPAAVFASPDRQTATIQMSVNYLRPAKAGETIIGIGKVVKMGKHQAYLEGHLERESDGEIILKATATNVYLSK